MKQEKLNWGGAGLLLAAIFPLSGQASDEDLYFSSLPMVASVSRLPQALADAPGSVTVIDREIIRQSGARELSDLMRLVPGFFATPHNQDAPRVVYHGLSNEANSPRVQVLVDGRSQYSPLFNSGVNWNLLPVALEDIDRVEVIRGSNSAAYGSNAFMGVINIITQDASQARGWMFSANHGNRSIRDETLRWGGKVGNADVRLTYQQKSDSGLKKMESDGSWFDPHDSLHTHLVDLRTDLSLTDRDELRFSLSQVASVSQYGRPNDTVDPFRDYAQSSTAFNLGWRRTVSETEEIRLDFSRVEDWGSNGFLAMQKISLPPPYPPTTTLVYPVSKGGKSTSNVLEFQHVFSLLQATRLAWGLKYSDASVRSEEQFYDNIYHARQTYRAFSNLEWRASPSWVFNLGGSLEKDSIGGTVFDPRISVSYHLAPEHTLRLIASRAHRTPSLYEAGGDSRLTAISSPIPVQDRTFLAVPDLKPERMDTLEAGYLADIKSLRATLDVRAFHERLPNRIQILPSPLPATACEYPSLLLNRVGPTSWVNCGRADAAVNAEKISIRGYEYQLRWQPFETTRLIYGHAYISIYANLTDPNSIADDSTNLYFIARNASESAPRHSTSAMLMQRLPYGLEASVMYYKQGFMRWTRNSFIEPYERVDWRLAYPFRVGATRGELAYTAYAANGSYEGLRFSRVVNETHWISLRLNF